MKRLIFLLCLGVAMANDLKYEDSPYLKQHENNPVNWMAWSEKAFKKAKKEDKLIFLSIGYSTCHWCHVMEKESFEDEEVARILNKDYISIKVDREEMPDVDKYYQDIHYIINQRGGGWPLSVVLLPNKEVIFAATYIPKENRGQMMGFKSILNMLDKKYKNEAKEVLQISENIKDAYERYKNFRTPPVKLDEKVIYEFIKNSKQSFDDEHKGFGHAPKFPHASTLDVLLKVYKLTKDKDAFDMAKNSLFTISTGGINDQIEGGFYRYSVDEEWMIPHFEKMLYTNAELLSAYSELYDLQPDLHVKDVIAQTVEAMNERFLYNGLYFSASDADSEGEEGKYFVFSFKEAKNALKMGGFDENESNEILEFFNISEFGNFEHNLSNPHVTSKSAPKNLLKAKSVLKELRSKVEYPFIDTKILTSWNALFISALFDAGEKVDEKYLKMAKNSLDKLIKTMYKDEKLYHQILPNSTLKVEALLEDYAFLSEALLKAYMQTNLKNYLELAQALIKQASEKFYKNGRWYLGGFKSFATLEDNAYKSSLASIIHATSTLALLNGDAKLFDEAKKMFLLNLSNFAKYPNAYPSGLFTWIILNKKQTLLKVPKKQFEKTKKRVKGLKNPLILVIQSDEDIFQACEISSCYAYGEDLEKVLEEVEKRYKD